MYEVHFTPTAADDLSRKTAGNITVHFVRHRREVYKTSWAAREAAYKSSCLQSRSAR